MWHLLCWVDEYIPRPKFKSMSFLPSGLFSWPLSLFYPFFPLLRKQQVTPLSKNKQTNKKKLSIIPVLILESPKQLADLQSGPPPWFLPSPSRPHSLTSLLRPSELSVGSCFPYNSPAGRCLCSVLCLLRYVTLLNFATPIHLLRPHSQVTLSSPWDIQAFGSAWDFSYILKE